MLSPAEHVYYPGRGTVQHWGSVVR
jgi:hypothetical protein